MVAWQDAASRIWSFRKSPGSARLRKGIVKTLSPPVDPDEAAAGTWNEALEPVDAWSFNWEFIKLQQEWMAGEGTQHKEDNLYAYKFEHGVALEPHDRVVVETIVKHADPGSEIVEIGSGHGALAVFMAHHGFIVRGFESDRRRFAAASWHLERYRTRHPKVAGRVEITLGFFPEAADLSPRSRARKRIGVATNITSTFTATHHKEVLDALRKHCDEVIVDLGRFGLSRNTQRERDALRETMAGAGFEAVERIHSEPPYEYWRFRVVPPGAMATAPVPASAPAPATVVLQLAGEAVFPLRTPTAGTLYSVFGDRRIDACPVCLRCNSVHLWRMPMTSIKEPVKLFGGYFNQVPTLQVPATVFCFDFCMECESIYLNPALASQKEQYRQSDHYIRTMQAGTLWHEYEDVFDQFAKWIPAGATTLMDAACGIGPYLEVARRREPDRWRRLIGLELSEKYVEHMRVRGLEAYAFDIDTDDLVKLVGRDTIDFIAFCEAFEHVERPLGALAKLLSVLKPGGRLYFTAQRYGRDVQAAVRPGEPIYIGEKVLRELPQRLGCRVVHVATSSMRYYVVLEKSRQS